jgi:hypothetical protein
MEGILGLQAHLDRLLYTFCPLPIYLLVGGHI